MWRFSTWAIIPQAILLLVFSVVGSSTANALPRSWDVGNGPWFDGPGNNLFWNPADEPDSDDIANFLDADTVWMTTNNEVAGVNVTAGANVRTEDQQLIVNGSVNILGGSTFSAGGNNHSLFPGTAFTAESVNVTGAGAQFYMAGSSTSQHRYGAADSSGTFTIGEGATFLGNGSLYHRGTTLTNPTTVLNNNGWMVVREYFDDGTLYFLPDTELRLWALDSEARIDLDGSGETGTVSVFPGTVLRVDLPLADPFSNTLALSGGSAVDFSHPWTLDTGTISSSFDGVSIQGAPLLQTGGLISNAGSDPTHGIMRFEAPFHATGGIIENYGTLVFEEDSTLDAGAGLSMQNFSRLEVTAGTELTISQTNFDMDAIDGNHVSYIVNDGAVLKIDVDDYDAYPALTSFGGVISVVNGQADVRVADNVFVTTGLIILRADEEDSAVWSGDTLKLGAGLEIGSLYISPEDAGFYQGAELLADGPGRALVEPRLIINLDGIVDIRGGSLRLEGGNSSSNPNLIEGGFIRSGTFGGVLNIATNRTLQGFGVIGSDIGIDGDGSAQLVAHDGELQMRGEILGLGRLRFRQTGTLTLGQPLDTSVLQNEILGGGGVLQGAAIHLTTKPLRGHGTVYNALNNENQIISADGNLLLDNPASDYDGTDNSGHLQLQTNLEIIDDAAFNYRGTIQVENNRELFANGFSLNLAVGSATTLNGGKFRSTHGSNFGGTLVVTSSATTASLDNPGENIFQSGSVTNLQGDLLLDVATTVIESGASFSGIGTLINPSTAEMVLRDNSLLNVTVQNDGFMAIGSSPGEATVSQFVQSSTGVLEVEIESSLPNNFDKLTVSDAMNLDGTLDVSLLSGFVPDPWDTVTILSAASRSGEFSTSIRPPTLPALLTHEVIYGATDVQLQFRRVLSADFDLDGDVDQDDLSLWEGDFGVNGDSDADGDGDSDGADFFAWQRQYGSSIPAPVTAVPEPATGMLIVVALFGSTVVRRRRLAEMNGMCNFA